MIRCITLYHSGEWLSRAILHKNVAVLHMQVLKGPHAVSKWPIIIFLCYIVHACIYTLFNQVSPWNNNNYAAFQYRAQGAIGFPTPRSTQLYQLHSTIIIIILPKQCQVLAHPTCKLHVCQKPTMILCYVIIKSQIHHNFSQHHSWHRLRVR